MNRGPTGRFITTTTVGGEACKAFSPNPLPPNPELDLYSGLLNSLNKALLSLGRLDSVTILLPDTFLFDYMYIRKEAVLSSQIEGTQSSLSDFLMHESGAAPGVPLDDVIEISNYISAMDYGLKRIGDGFPISIRLIREIHAKLLASGRGSAKAPGEFRRSQNWIGGDRPGNAVYVPPPHEEVIKHMGDLEVFIHNADLKMPALIKTALVHAQFETIHPFLDGNGRVGRLLIALLLYSEKILRYPMLYLSLYFKSHRNEYYSLLQDTRTNGEWESWTDFFLEGVHKTADQAVNTAKALVNLIGSDRNAIESCGRIAGSALRVHHAFQRDPIQKIQTVIDRTGLSFPTAQRVIEHLCDMGILAEIPMRKRARLFIYKKYTHVLSEGTEPLGSQPLL
jgi:Fic family protein